MKRTLCLILTCVMFLGIFSGCSAEPDAAPATTGATTAAPTEPAATEPAPTESPEEANVLKIMILGSSRSVNAFHFLYQAFKDQMPDQELVLGIMYYSGCSMSMHTEFIQTNQPVYRYYLNTTGKWTIRDDVHMMVGLKDQNWDVILLQAGSGDLENEVNKTCRNFLKEYVDSQVEHPHTLWWHSTWFNSTDPSLFDPSKTKLDPNAIDQYKQITDQHTAVKAHVFDDPMFSGHITSGTPMLYALKVLEIPETELYRDHTHLSDYGCLLVAYAWYAQFTGNPVTQINIDTIDTVYRQSHYRNLGPMAVTEEMKAAIIETVQYTLDNPWGIPEK